MTDRPAWAPQDIDINLPSAARMYDYYLGGGHNFAADREVAERALAIMPEGRQLAQINRAFLRRAVRFCVAAGLRQFLDLGSGIPTLGNVHEVAQAASPLSKVVYVDIDPVAVAHSRALLESNDLATAVLEDLRKPESVLTNPAVRGLLDLKRPVALLMLSVLHFVQDEDDPAMILGTLRDALAPGSALVIAHGTADGRTEDVEKVTALYRGTANPLRTRSRDEVIALFDGWDLTPPGVVWAPLWHPDGPVDPQPQRSGVYVGMAYKR